MYPQSPKPGRPWPRLASQLLPLAVAAALITATYYWYNWHPRFLEPGWTAAYHRAAGGWQRLPEVPWNIEALQVSNSGTVWALAGTHNSGSILARLDGAAWHIYSGKDWGVKEGYLASETFVLDGEELWVSAYDGILHGDGSSWKLYRDVKASALVAQGGRAWAIDEKGHLLQFEAGEWKPLVGPPAGEKWNDHDDWHEPKLARTPDGSLWLARSSLWRLDRGKWREVDTGFEDPSLLGVAGDRIWLWDGPSLRSISIEDESQTVYSTAQTGLAKGEWVYAAAGHAGRTYFATFRGMVEFDGATWRRIPGPGNGVRQMTQVRVAPNGDLWVLGDIPNPAWKYTQIVRFLVPPLLSLALLAVPVWLVRSAKRTRLQEHQQVQAAVEHFTGEAPELLQRTERRLQKESSWAGAFVAVTLPIASFIGYLTLRTFWRSAPVWTFLALAVLFHAVYVLWRSRVKRRPKPWDPIEPGGPGYEWTDVRRSLPGTLLLFVLMNFSEVNRAIGDPVLWILYAVLVWSAHRMISRLLYNAAIRRGEYDRALAFVRWFHCYNPGGSRALRFRGFALMMAGRSREAEEVLRRAIARETRNADQAYALDHLGDALLDQGRYQEAMRSFEAALRAQTGFRRPYRGMAEALLRQHKDPQRALELVESIAGSSGPSRNRWTVNGEVRDDYWGLKAWALAELGRGGEVASAVENAFGATNLKSPADAAATCYRAGMAMLAAGNEGAGIAYLKRACEADPKGRRGALARSALEERKRLPIS
ncbi:MAG TPA: tetratricopeptide repeat protein [Candidatus Acidoferrales bacterium]|nr:tetratricopeptide repeat protein [Candidatus Acidoferrales bacterium]